ncbi:hypothetical protein M501DRAFT_719062 [Patellaria atrata CBS 101060]|uniref:Uncharacterized protein n=1 Tax=Patellaria atrata CBS 101060 TaxID=1346257 RepID=A0A9P4SBD7_9PEZI|nr:hypothetical protein M501DRAFT_719062 [Patellaria atrata CBS 101060]
MDNKPSTENGSDRDSDSFEDAPDSTVRRDSSSRTRSLTRRDSTSSDRTRSLTRRESGITTTTNESRDPEMRHPLSNGDTEGEEQQDQKSPNLTAHRISVHSMDDMQAKDTHSPHPPHPHLLFLLKFLYGLQPAQHKAYQERYR